MPMKTRTKARISIALACIAAAMLVASALWIRGSFVPLPYGAALVVMALVLIVVAVKLTPPHGLRRTTPMDKQD